MITVILTTFRRPELLKRSISSLLKQTYTDLQVCVYDNASGDGTEEIVRTFMKEDSRVHYHCHSENIGMMANYKYAFSQINTKYFSILSDDDYLLPHCFEIAMQGFEKHPDAALSATAIKAVNPDGKILAISLNPWQKSGYFAAREGLSEMIKDPIFPTGVVINHHLVKEIEPDYSEEILIRWDTDYLLQIVAQHPFVVNRRISGVFLFHPQGYSTAFLRQMNTNFSILSHYLEATGIMKNHLLTTLKNYPKERKEAKKSLASALENEINHHFLSSPIQSKNEEFMKGYWKALSTYQKWYGIDSFIFKSILRTLLFTYAPRLVPYARSALKLKRSIVTRIKRQFFYKTAKL